MNALDALNDALAVAGGNRELRISISMESLVMVGIAVFIAMLLATIIAGFLTR